jgi:hypothetical protein
MDVVWTRAVVLVSKQKLERNRTLDDVRKRKLLGNYIGC